jgi:putative DNA methylase
LNSETHDIYWNDTLIGKSLGTNKPPILVKNQTRCAGCGHRYQDDLARPYYRRYIPLAITGLCEKDGLYFAAPKPQDLDAITRADEQRESLGFDPTDFPIPPGPKSRSLVNRGVKSYLDLFTSRQLLFLHNSIALLAKSEPKVRLNLSLLVSTSLEFNSMLCGYKGAQRPRPGAIRHAFAHHAYAFPYTALENNPVFPALTSGSLMNLFHTRLLRGRAWATNPIERRLRGSRPEKVTISGETDMGTEGKQLADLLEGQKRFLLKQGSSVSLALPDECVDYIVTDPPYFDSVQYTDLAAFFRVWLRKMLPEGVNWVYAPTESAVDPHSGRVSGRLGEGDGQYASVLSSIFAECHRVLKQSGRLIFTFHHWNPKGWSALTLALKRAGFVLVNRYVVHAENRASVHIVNQNALLHDVILVLASVESDARIEWSRPQEIDKDDSQEFCEVCGTMVGWMLGSTMSETEIEVQWHSLLA